MKFSIHRAGWAVIPIVLILFFSIGILLFFFTPIWFSIPIIAVGVVVWVWVISFFRVPKRIIPSVNNNQILCPADGKVVLIERLPNNPFFDGEAYQVSIFMNIYNVHRNLFPVNGVLSKKAYSKGHHKLAKQAKASELNEQSVSIIRADNGEIIVVKQIAGAMARRVLNYANEGEIYKAGDELGFIRFGSRVDIIFSTKYSVLLPLESKVKSGISFIAELK